MKLAAAWKVLAGAGVLGAGLGGATAVLLGSAVGGSGDDSPRVGIEEPESQSADEPRGGIDYNCNLPGQGFPWLEHYDYRFEGVGRSGVFASTVAPFYQLGLPVDLGPGGDVDYGQVYGMLCRVHPDLGGTEVRHMTPDEIAVMSIGKQLPNNPEVYYTDGQPPADQLAMNPGDSGQAAPAAEGTEPFRVFYLPPIPQDLLDKLTTATTTSTTKAEGETQRWRVSLTGYEIDDLNVRATDGRTAVRFNYTLQADFTLVKRDGSWTFGTSTITSPTIRVSELYEPDQQWELKPLQCGDCDSYARSGKLFVDVNGDGVRFSWGVNPIRVTVQSRRIDTCVPMPSCSEWLARYHHSATFFGRVSGHRIPLKGFEETWTYTSSAGDRWVAYTYKLTRLDSS